MEKYTELNGLIEKAALAAKAINPINVTEVEELQKILNHISQTILEQGEYADQLFQQIKSTSFDAAQVLQKIIKKQVKNTDKSIEPVLQAVTTIQNLIDQTVQETVKTDCASIETDLSTDIETGAQADMCISEDDVPLILDFISESAEHIESAEAALLKLETEPNDSELINQIFRAFHTIKGVAGCLNLADIGSLAHWTENMLDLVRKGQLFLDSKNSDLVFKSLDYIKKMLSELKKSVETGEPRVEQPDLRQLMARLKKCLSGQMSIDPVPIKAKGFPDKETRSGLDHRSDTDRRAGAEEKIKVSTVRLDNMVNMVGELVIAQLMITEETTTKLVSEHGLNRKVTHQGKIVRELQELSMSMRMVPIQGAFQKMARLVHDLSRKSGKDVNFVTIGDETELDRNIVDKIIDPLVHMVRNSVDHGIESPEERKEMGKNPNGRIELRAFHQAGNVIIEIEDDGRGLNKDRILKKSN